MLYVDDHDPVKLSAGDIALLPHGCGHTFASYLDATPIPLLEVMANRVQAESPHPVDESADITRLICGTYEFDHAVPHPLLRLLPERIVLRAGEAPAVDALTALVTLPQREITLARPGTRTIACSTLYF